MSPMPSSPVSRCPIALDGRPRVAAISERRLLPALIAAERRRVGGRVVDRGLLAKQQSALAEHRARRVEQPTLYPGVELVQ